MIGIRRFDRRMHAIAALLWRGCHFPDRGGPWISKAWIEAVAAVVGRVLDLEMVPPLLDAPVPVLLPACCAEGFGGKTNGYSMVDRLADGWVALEPEAKIAGLNCLI